MKKHPVKIDGYDTLEEAAIAVGKMRYDKISEFLKHMAYEMVDQQKKDHSVGKVKLAEDTTELIAMLLNADHAAKKLFEKYKKYMKDELE